MPHSHNIYDVDKRFVINVTTRSISTPETNIPVLVQYDHNSEHITFEASRFVEGHDLSLCDKVEVHYNNIGGRSRTSKGVYEVKDFRVDPRDDSKVVFTWVLSEKATYYEGSLAYIIAFSCTNNDGELFYRWNTNVNEDLKVSSGIYNGEAVEEMYADVLEAWKNDLFGIGDTEEARMKAVSQTQQNLIQATGEEVGRLTDEYKTALVEKANQLLATIPDTSEELQATVNELIESQYIPKTTIDGNTITETYNDGHTRVTTIDGDTVTENWYTVDGVLTKTNVITISQNGVVENMTTV